MWALGFVTNSHLGIVILPDSPGNLMTTKIKGLEIDSCKLKLLHAYAMSEQVKQQQSQHCGSHLTRIPVTCNSSQYKIVVPNYLVTLRVMRMGWCVLVSMP